MTQFTVDTIRRLEPLWHFSGYSWISSVSTRVTSRLKGRQRGASAKSRRILPAFGSKKRNKNDAWALSIHLMMINTKHKMTACLPSLWQNQTAICEEWYSLPGLCSLLVTPLLSYLCFSKWRGKCTVIQHLLSWKLYQWRDKLVGIFLTRRNSKC